MTKDKFAKMVEDYETEIASLETKEKALIARYKKNDTGAEDELEVCQNKLKKVRHNLSEKNGRVTRKRKREADAKELDSLKNGQTSEEHWAIREMASDRQLHELVANHCGSTRLTEEIRRYNRLIQAIREIVGNQQHAQQLALDEHCTIVEALLRHDSDASAKAMAVHINRTASSVEEVIFGNSN